MLQLTLWVLLYLGAYVVEVGSRGVIVVVVAAANNVRG